MRTALFLFIAAVIWLFSVPVLQAYFGYQTVQREQLDAPIAQAELEPYFNPIIAPGSDRVERAFDVDYKGSYEVRKGFHLVHDGSLGQEAYFSGPAEVLDVVYVGGNEDEWITFGFSRPVQLNEPVIVRLNLNEHHIGHLNLVFHSDPIHPEWLNFTAKDPLLAHQLEFSGELRTDTLIPLETTFVRFNGDIGTNGKQPVFTGRSVNVNLGNLQSPLNLDGLKSELSTSQYEYPYGRQLYYRGNTGVTLWYDRAHVADQGDDSLTIKADTIRVSVGTEVSAFLNGEEAKVKDDRLVFIIRE